MNADAIWSMGDIGYGLMAWANIIAIALLAPKASAMLEDYEQQKKEGKNPFTLDSKEPTGNFREFLLSEVRYSSLQRTFPEIAEELFEQTEATAKERLEGYKKLAQG